MVDDKTNKVTIYNTIISIGGVVCFLVSILMGIFTYFILIEEMGFDYSLFWSTITFLLTYVIMVLYYMSVLIRNKIDSE